MFAKQIHIRPIDHTNWLLTVLLLAMLPALYVELTGDFPGAALFYGQQEDSWLTGIMLNGHAAVFATIATGWNAIMNTLYAITNLFA
jgi:hypothetical protein